MTDKKEGDSKLIGLHPTRRRPRENSRQRAKRVAGEFFEALRELEKRQGDLRQPRPGEKRR